MLSSEGSTTPPTDLSIRLAYYPCPSAQPSAVDFLSPLEERAWPHPTLRSLDIRHLDTPVCIRISFRGIPNLSSLWGISHVPSIWPRLLTSDSKLREQPRLSLPPIAQGRPSHREGALSHTRHKSASGIPFPYQTLLAFGLPIHGVTHFKLSLQLSLAAHIYLARQLRVSGFAQPPSFGPTRPNALG